MYYSYVEIEYVATSVSPARMDLALKLLRLSYDFAVWMLEFIEHMNSYIRSNLMKTPNQYVQRITYVSIKKLTKYIEHMNWCIRSIQIIT